MKKLGGKYADMMGKLCKVSKNYAKVMNKNLQQNMKKKLCRNCERNWAKSMRK